jgi:hypothetical protein
MSSSTARFLAQVRLGSAAITVPEPRDGDWQLAPPRQEQGAASVAHPSAEGSKPDDGKAAREPRVRRFFEWWGLPRARA